MYVHKDSRVLCWVIRRDIGRDGHIALLNLDRDYLRMH